MVYCSHCGKEIPSDSKFCPSCGAAAPVIVNQPVETEREVTQPVRKESVVTEPAGVKKDIVTRKTINEFYKDSGFWGGLLLIAGFFLPFFSHNGASLYDSVSAEAATDKIVLLWLIFPVAGLFMFLHSLQILPGVLAIFFTFFALIALIYWGYVMLNDRTRYFGTDEIFSVIKTVGVGLWAILLGTILLLFHRRHTKVVVHHTKYVDRNL
ncbi:MAG: zinc ribbon domain-containing protein [Bacteroidota bacterium]|nr:zinc ribbon domain-containing protein [Bacteroidota bacterium]